MDEYGDESESDDEYESVNNSQAHRVNFAVEVQDVDKNQERATSQTRVIKSALKDKKQSSTLFSKLNEDELKINSSQLNSVSSNTVGPNSIERIDQIPADKNNQA